MKLFIICSKAFFKDIKSIREYFLEKGVEVHVPHTYDNPDEEDRMRGLGKVEHANFKARMFKLSEEKIKEMDAVLVLNFEKHGIPNYIGGSTFLEMYEAFKGGKKIYLYNPIPDGLLYDEIEGFSPIIINGDLSKVEI